MPEYLVDLFQRETSMTQKAHLPGPFAHLPGRMVTEPLAIEPVKGGHPVIFEFGEAGRDNRFSHTPFPEFTMNPQWTVAFIYPTMSVDLGIAGLVEQTLCNQFLQYDFYLIPGKTSPLQFMAQFQDGVLTPAQ